MRFFYYYFPWGFLAFMLERFSLRVEHHSCSHISVRNHKYMTVGSTLSQDTKDVKQQSGATQPSDLWNTVSIGIHSANIWWAQRKQLHDDSCIDKKSTSPRWQSSHENLTLTRGLRPEAPQWSNYGARRRVSVKRHKFFVVSVLRPHKDHISWRQNQYVFWNGSPSAKNLRRCLCIFVWTLNSHRVGSQKPVLFVLGTDSRQHYWVLIHF